MTLVDGGGGGNGEGSTVFRHTGKFEKSVILFPHHLESSVLDILSGSSLYPRVGHI